MLYLSLAFSCLWLCTFVYLFALDRQIKDISRRLSARVTSSKQQ
ncbi:CcmD family protein [Planctomycetota bacterium]